MRSLKTQAILPRVVAECPFCYFTYLLSSQAWRMGEKGWGGIRWVPMIKKSKSFKEITLSRPLLAAGSVAISVNKLSLEKVVPRDPLLQSPDWNPLEEHIQYSFSETCYPSSYMHLGFFNVRGALMFFSPLEVNYDSCIKYGLLVMKFTYRKLALLF